MSKLAESEVKKQIRDVLKSCKIDHWNEWQGPMSVNGVSDILGYYKGRGLAIEVKHSEWKPPSPGTNAFKHYKRQKDFIEMVKRNQGYAFFATSVEIVIDELGLEVKLYPLFAGRKAS